MGKEKLIRFGVSLPEDLLTRFDALIESESYPNRSEAIRDLMRESLIKREWQAKSQDVAGAITLVYDHHQRELVKRLTDLQHDFHSLIISSQHIHLDHDNCLEVIVVKGTTKEVLNLSRVLRATKGVKFGELTMASTGRRLK